MSTATSIWRHILVSAHTLPLNPSPQVRGLSLDVLAQAVRSAGPGPLAPLAPALVPGLLEALSGLEVCRRRVSAGGVRGYGDPSSWVPFIYAALASRPTGSVASLQCAAMR
jgi:hypothetical protein